MKWYVLAIGVSVIFGCGRASDNLAMQNLAQGETSQLRSEERDPLGPVRPQPGIPVPVVSAPERPLNYDCYTYGRRSFDQYRGQDALGCGKNDANWHANVQAHITTCQQNGVDWAWGEDLARQNVVKQCMEQVSFAGGCDEYTDRAMRQYLAAYHLNCGFTGPRWARHRENHLTWCRVASPDFIAYEDAGRRDELVQCLAYKSPAVVPPPRHREHGSSSLQQ